MVARRCVRRGACHAVCDKPLHSQGRTGGVERSALSTGPYQRLVPLSRSVPHYSSRMAWRRPGAPDMGMGGLDVPLPGLRDAMRETLDK